MSHACDHIILQGPWLCPMHVITLRYFITEIDIARKRPMIYMFDNVFQHILDFFSYHKVTWRTITNDINVTLKQKCRQHITAVVPLGVLKDVVTTHPGLGVTKPIFSVPLFSHFFSEWSKQRLPVGYQVYIWQVSPQRSCGDTWQIWTWLKVADLYFC